MTLVLSRRVNEIIDIIAPDKTRIEVIVVEIQGGYKVRLGVNAPREWLVHRREVTDAIDRNGGVDRKLEGRELKRAADANSLQQAIAKLKKSEVRHDD